MPDASLSGMTKPEDHDVVIGRLSKDIAQCQLCAAADNPNPLPHPPRPVVRISSTARLCIVGQAPGNRVNLSGTPFDDASGDRLRTWMGVDRDAFYDTSRIAIVPMGFCFPGYDANKCDLPPRKECAPRWREDVFAAMPQIELILAIGQYAQKWHMGGMRSKTLTETVANWRQPFERNQPPRILPLPHPSWRNTGWLKRNPWFEAEVVPALQAAVRLYVSSVDIGENKLR